MPLKMLTVGSRGTEACLTFARETGARFILDSTSEVYGEPLEHPQRESDWGNVNLFGSRSVYDEAKRFAEAITLAYGRYGSLDVGIVRIFNTYGPRLRLEDGHVVSNFIEQALSNRSLTAYGEGTQIRSFYLVDDFVGGLLAMVDARGLTGPVNLGNLSEVSVLEPGTVAQELTRSSSPLSFHESLQDDPTKRRPDICLALATLQWSPAITLGNGLARTIARFGRQSGVGVNVQ